MYAALLLVAAAVHVDATDPRVMIVGRVTRSDGAVVATAPATELRVRFTGTSIGLDAAGAGAFTLVVDGLRSEGALEKPRATLLVHTLAPGDHELSWSKRDAQPISIFAVQVDDGATLLPPPPPRTRRVEWIAADAVHAAQLATATTIAARFGADLIITADASQVPLAPLVDHPPDVIVVDLQEGPTRGPFFARAHAVLDDARRTAPLAFIVLASSNTEKGAGWCRAIFTKRGDGQMSWVRGTDAAALGDEVAKRLRW